MKRLIIGLLVLLALSQLPFAYRCHKLSRLHAAIQQLNSQRVPTPAEDHYIDYAGVIHVHSFLGGHSSGSFSEIIEAAKQNALKFVVMTEHPASEFNTAEATLKGMHAGILFVNGNEVRTREGDRLLVIPGDEVTGTATELSTHTVSDHAKTRGELAVVAYPDDFKSWDSNTSDAIEVYNVYTNARHINPILAFFDTIWTYGASRDLLFSTFYTRPSSALKKWDEATRNRRVVALAGNDAHANIGISVVDSAGRSILGLKLDPYATSFHLVRVHLLLPQGTSLDARSLVEGLAQGHCFIGFDLFGDTSGFSFTGNSSNFGIQGDEIALANKATLSVSTPVPSRIVLIKNGQPVQEANSINWKDFVVTEKGSYRVEVYLRQLGQPVADQPWIISNPIYVN